MKQLSQKAHAAAFHAEFFGSTTQDRYVLGINPFADAVADRVNPDGFIDESTSLTEYRGKPVVKLSDIPAGSMVISTETQHTPKSALNKLLRLNGVASMDYFAVADASHFLLPQVPAISDTQKEHAAHPEKFEWVRDLFADQESREVFNRIMEFRLNANLRAMRFFNCTIEQQFYEPFLKFSPGEVFVDAGIEARHAIDAFAARYPYYGWIHCMESDEASLQAARKHQAASSKIEFHPIALGDGKNAAIENSLDDRVSESVSFIRLDMKGAELKALEGMKWHIQEDHPKLAISVHNDPAHFWQVPEFILDICSDYKVYLRHYSEGLADTVMYFIPA
ncbi:MAG TPA: FkbM family methyltransferase [Limnobacter sp.]|nr:FkbM family methyltransferase [Limnobacter sp.]